MPAAKYFLYGLPYLKDRGCKVAFIETDQIFQSRYRLTYWMLRLEKERISKVIGINNCSHFIVNQSKILSKYTDIVATNYFIG